MKTKNIFKTVALAMMMPAMLLTTACSNQDDVANTSNITSKGYALPVTVNVTRQDGATRATFDGSKLNFSGGDKLFVSGSYNEGNSTFAGMLDYVSDGKFSGTIMTQTKWSRTTEELLSEDGGANATLLPAGYGEYGYLSIADEGTYEAWLSENPNKAFATSKATAVEQFSWEDDNEYSSGFELTPVNAILNFTINGLDASTEVDVSFSYPNYPDPIVISGTVTTDGDGIATFAIGIIYANNLKDCTLTVGGNAIALPDKEVEAGKIYNISRSVPAPPAGALSGKFTINGSGNKVMFSQGNLQATTTDLGVNWSWAFAAHQWEYIGAANDKINGNGTVSANGTVDLFGWVGASSTWTGAAMYGISAMGMPGTEDGYGNVADENLKSDWGNTIASGWRTLTKDEWDYLFNTRTTGGTVDETAEARYTFATIRTDVSDGVNGIILFPDGVNFAKSEFTKLGQINDPTYYVTKCTSAQWTNLESRGCVFLPAAGYRHGNSVSTAALGRYWSSSPYTDLANESCRLYFIGGTLNCVNSEDRNLGMSVRLIYPAE